MSISHQYELKASGFTLALKRFSDVVVSALGLILFFPLTLAIVLAIYFEDGRPVIFHQERIGFNGKAFTLLKFRTMRVDAEKDGLPQLCCKGDNRLTRIGKFLRNHHLDEMPQLINVLRGDMSLVGYRPERKFYIDQIIANNPNYVFLYQIRPGVFSNATLYNGYTDTMEKMLKRLEMDLDYLSHISFFGDLNIIIKTFFPIIMGKKF